MNTFFVAGAPRSGTAFVANLLTTDRSICLHEGLKFITEGGTYTDLFSRLGELSSTEREFFGDSGAHIAFIYKELLKEFPEAKFLILTRNENDLYRAAHAAGLSMQDSWMCIQGLEQLAKDTNYLDVPFEQLFTQDGAKRVWDFCLGTPFDYARWVLLSRNNVQTSKFGHEESLDFVKSGVAKSLLTT